MNEIISFGWRAPRGGLSHVAGWRGQANALLACSVVTARGWCQACTCCVESLAGSRLYLCLKTRKGAELKCVIWSYRGLAWGMSVYIIKRWHNVLYIKKLRARVTNWHHAMQCQIIAMATNTSPTVFWKDSDKMNKGIHSFQCVPLNG